MENGMIAAIIGLLAAIIGGIIGAISAQSIVQRRIQIENVTQERAKWRDKIRSLTPEVHNAIMMRNGTLRAQKLERYQNIFRTLLNPSDREDKEIISVIGLAPGHQNGQDEQAKEFGKRVSLLLKHDWERAKEEVKHPLFQCCEPKREGYKPEGENFETERKENKSWWRRCRYQIHLYTTLILAIPVIIIYIRFIIWFIEVIFCKCWPLNKLPEWCSIVG